METVIRTLNGVDVHQLKESITVVKQQPATGRFRFRATNEWIGGAQNQTSIKDFYVDGEQHKSRLQGFVLNNDQPEALLGNDKAANPGEILLHALAGCLTTSIVYHAAARGYKLEKVESSLEGEMDLQGSLGIKPSARNGYKSITVTYNIEGDLTQEQKEEILKFGPSYSPVFDVIANGTRVEVKLINN